MIKGYETEELRRRKVEALLRERAGARRNGRDQLVRAIDAELKAFGHRAQSLAQASRPRQRRDKGKAAGDG